MKQACSPLIPVLTPLLLVTGDAAISKELLSLLVIALIAAGAPLVLGLLRLRLAVMAAAWLLQRAGLIDDVKGIAIALTSTALGTLLPILRDWGELRSGFGRYFTGAGAMGEFGPILAISLLLGASNTGVALLSLLMFAAAALILARLPGQLGACCT